MIKGSVIITCYNEGQLILRAVESLRQQTFKEFEIILVNDSSNDEVTNKVCRELGNENIAILRTNSNLGPSGARNFGISKSKGDIIIPLDADDSLPKFAIESILNFFRSNPKCDFLFGNYYRINPKNNERSLINCKAIADENQSLNPTALWNNWILLGMTPHRRKIWEEIGGYSMKYSFTCQDVDFQLRAFHKGATFKYINEEIYNYFRSDSGINSSRENSEALIECWYDNIDFIIKYSGDYKEAFNIAISKKDYFLLSNWVAYETSQNNNSLLVKIFNLCPKKLYFAIVPMFLMIRNIIHLKRKINNG